MSLFAIADVHLSLGTDKPMDIFAGWGGYVDRLRENWCAKITPEDTVVIAGDISWAMKLEDCLADFSFLHALPGKKLIFKGNHDLWWTTMRKMESFLSEKGLSSISFVHNNAYLADGIAVCGSRGWFFDDTASDAKVIAREAARLERSIQAAKELSGEPVVFLHYPPVFFNQRCDEIMAVLHREEIRRCYYGHVHGAGRHQAVQGPVEGIEMRLISCDALQFDPIVVEKCPYEPQNQGIFG